MQKLSVEDLELFHKTVLVRVDYNVPLTDEGILDDMRIKETLPTIKYLIESQAKVILISHMGRPEGKKDLSLSLGVCATRLTELLEKDVKFVGDCIGEKVQEIVGEMEPKDVLLLENLRFYEAEEFPEKDPHFAIELASFAELYVNDAFGVSHRKHASVYEVPKLFKQAAAGFLLQKEIEFLSNKLLHPKRSFVAILGGAKVSTKVGVIKALLEKIDALMIGGAMAYTFLKALGKTVGDSFVEEKFVKAAKEILDLAKTRNIEVYLPIDFLVRKTGTQMVKEEEEIEEGFEGMSIGSKTVEMWSEKLGKAKTIFWNGPLGVFEEQEFSKPTFQIAKTIAKSKAISIAGGGDVVAAINLAGCANGFDHLSTGGGASLEFIEKGTLVGIEVLTDINKFF
ncbi:MAG: Bifunctional PGK/TIM [Chlamydiae bacterium]|nr:Bifunctional PGK/TIM [Chlamydiota bacterium]